MPSQITTRFFQVVRKEKSNRGFGQALKDIAAFESLDDRTATVSGTEYRLERHRSSKGVISCEIVKIQSDNLPAEVTPEGLDELDVDQIGFGIAFCYDESLSVIAMQYDNRIVSGVKICQYLAQFHDQNQFAFKAIPGPDLWSEFSNSSVKRFDIKVAVPQSFGGQFGSEVERSISKLSKIYDAPHVTIGLSVGHRKSTLAEIIKETAGEMLNTFDVTSMRAKTVESLEEIDLLEELLGYKDSIDVPKNPEDSYRSRVNFVQRAFDEHRKYLKGFVS